ncbi:MAG: clan AA aspartic protease [Saprospiraceae bacterium]|nr:clan AA aspartic protease [Saprospiraceae bacterium]
MDVFKIRAVIIIGLDQGQFASCTSGDKYTDKKLYNAFIYLITLLKASDKYKIKDSEDPFSPQNYNEGTALNNEHKIEVPLELKGGVYILSISICNNNYNYILDSGASETSITEMLESKFINQGFITKNNYLNPVLYKLADGSIVEFRRVMLPSIKIGNNTGKNVNVFISPSISPLLLGRNVLDIYKKWSIDTEKRVLILENY